MPLRPFIEAAPIHVDELQALAEAKQILASAKMRVSHELVLTYLREAAPQRRDRKQT